MEMICFLPISGVGRVLAGVGSFKEKIIIITGQPVVHLSFCPVSGMPGKQGCWRPVTGTLPGTRSSTLLSRVRIGAQRFARGPRTPNTNCQLVITTVVVRLLCAVVLHTVCSFYVVYVPLRLPAAPTRYSSVLRSCAALEFGAN